MNWKHGYYADSGYTYGWYVETMPMRMRWAAMVQGHQAPERRFRYLDAGCGQGVSLVLAAAAHPDSEFVGIDFLPDHIAHAKALAQACELTNVHFIEGDFIELASNPNGLGEFDFAVCHGITTWIAPEVKESLFRLIGKVLKPGGVFYNSYNTFPGWLSAVPFQHLVLLEQRSKTGALALKAAISSMERLQVHAPGMFGNLPGLAGRLKTMESQDPAYLVQEYNNHYWQPVFVTQMMDELAAVKLSYLGTATLPEAYDAVHPKEIRELISEQTVPATREQLRDYVLNQGFRRDLYVKGSVRPWALQQSEFLRKERFVANPLVERPASGEPYRIKVGGFELKGDATFYSWILDEVEMKDGKSLGELIDSQSDPGLRNSIPQAVSMLLHAGWLLPYADNGTQAAKVANRSLVQARMKGAPYNYVSLPSAGGALALADAEWAMLDAYQLHVKDSDWGDHVLKSLAQLGRALAREGKAITDTNEQRTVVDKAITEFRQSKLSLLQKLGAVD